MHVILAIGPGPTPIVLTAVALTALMTAAVIVVLVGGRRLTLRWTLASALLVVAGNAVVIPGLPSDGWPGYASWPIGAGTMICIGLTLRQRIAFAWVSMGALTVVCLAWSINGSAGPLAGLGLVERQIGVLLIGTLFAIGLRRAARSAAEFAEVQRRQALERDLAETEVRARGDAARRVLAVAGPTLELIASERTLDIWERARIAALEGRLRDEIAIAPLLSESLDHALNAARSRGVDAVVLTEASVGDLPTAVRLRAADWLASRLNQVVGTQFVGRVVLRGRDVRVSAAVDDAVEDRLLLDE
ncbi:hypothetical protein [uncultured Amnibacterium sp.]|uniref:hypothetical protein n=1 Tax=uncultured Amnibacterium sp. TaxID=1631851 RepID=UPI0035CC55DA